MTKEQVENLQEAKAAADKHADAPDGRERYYHSVPLQ